MWLREYEDQVIFILVKFHSVSLVAFFSTVDAIVDFHRDAFQV